MARLLYIKASPREDDSYSVRAANAFVESYRKSHPDDEIVTMDLFTANLPEFDCAGVTGRYAFIRGGALTEEQASAWEKIKTIIDHFKSFDKYVIAVPMWNFGIPYKLKQYIDLITHPTFTFGYKDGERIGYVTGKPVVCFLARGGEYKGAKKKIDFQKPYLEWALEYIGFTEITSIVIEPTLAGNEIANERLEKAIRKAKRLAKIF